MFLLQRAKLGSRDMVNRCAVFGCGSTADTAHGISTYSFPKNRAIRRTWVKFVKTTRTNFMDPKPDGTSATVCSKHFSEDCFEVPPSDKPLERSFQKKCRRLKKDAVPTIPSKKPLLLLKELYPYIRCALCTGFLIDATTITECLHTFCKSCIVKHFFCSNKCPTCSIVVHQTQPLYNVRPDRQLQDIVYQTVPHLEEAEKERMCAFYKERELPIPIKATPSVFSVQLLKQKQKDPILQSVFTIPPELDVSVMLDFVGAEEGIENYKPLERKYIRVSGEATIRHVELFIRRKMELTPNLKVDVVCGEHLLEQCQSLNEVQTTMGKNALQDGMLVLQYGLVLPPQ